MKIYQWEVPDFFLEIEFSLKHGESLCSYYMLMRLNFDPTLVKLAKWSPPIRDHIGFRGPGLAQWWERLLPTNMTRVRFLDPAWNVGWICCWFSSLLRGLFSGYSGFSLSLKTNICKFQFDPGMHALFWTSSCELVGAAWVNKLHLHFGILAGRLREVRLHFDRIDDAANICQEFKV